MPCKANLSNSILCCLDILFLMRRLTHDGSPLFTVANSLLYDISLRSEFLSSLEKAKKEWLSRLMTTGEFLLQVLIGSI